jgi:hypothetical protein
MDKITDPRTDLVEDSRLWLQLLEGAGKISRELYGLLHYFRCTGMRVIWGKTQYVLRPTIDPYRGYDSMQEYEKDRAELLKWTSEVNGLLDGLGNSQKGRSDV